MGVSEGLLDVPALSVACMSVGFVVVVLSRALPSATELLDFCAEVLALLVETCNGAGKRVGPRRRGFDACLESLDYGGNERVDALAVCGFWYVARCGEAVRDRLPEDCLVRLSPEALSVGVAGCQRQSMVMAMGGGLSRSQVVCRSDIGPRGMQPPPWRKSSRLLFLRPSIGGWGFRAP